MNYECAAVSHVGKIRSGNEDNFYVNDCIRTDFREPVYSLTDHGGHPFHTYGVFDGMGGAEAGEVASYLAARTLAEYNGINLEYRFGDYIRAANAAVCNEINGSSIRQIGTTAAVLRLKGDRAYVCNIGDSRVYRYHGSVLQQLSLDHTLEQQMRVTNQGEESAARTKAHRHILLQNLGIREEEFLLEPYINNHIEVCPGDWFLLCSDGLHEMLDDEDIQEILRGGENAPVEACARALVDKALQRGGTDNITVIVIKAEERVGG